MDGGIAMHTHFKHWRKVLVADPNGRLARIMELVFKNFMEEVEEMSTKRIGIGIA